MFCQCRACGIARQQPNLHKRMSESSTITDRQKALAWTPPKPTDEAEEETAP